MSLRMLILTACLFSVSARSEDTVAPEFNVDAFTIGKLHRGCKQLRRWVCPVVCLQRSLNQQ